MFRHTWSDQYLNDVYTIRSGIQIPLIGYVAVADRFTTTEITYIQVGLPSYLKPATLLITYLGYLYMTRQKRVCLPIFSLLTFDFVFSISQG